MTNLRALLVAFVISAPAAAPAAELTVCRTIDDYAATAIGHKHEIVRLSDQQFATLRAAFDKDGLPMPDGITAAYATPALDDGTAVILIGVKADSCVWGTISRSVDWVWDTFGMRPA